MAGYLGEGNEAVRPLYNAWGQLMNVGRTVGGYVAGRLLDAGVDYAADTGRHLFIRNTTDTKPYDYDGFRAYSDDDKAKVRAWTNYHLYGGPMPPRYTKIGAPVSVYAPTTRKCTRSFSFSYGERRHSPTRRHRRAVHMGQG